MLYHTSRDPYFLVCFELSELARDFVFGFLSDGAGIEDDNIRLFDVFCI